MKQCVSRSWVQIAKNIKANNNQGISQLQELPTVATAQIGLFILGHLSIPGNEWHPTEHYRNRSCGHTCKCCMAMTNHQHG